MFERVTLNLLYLVGNKPKRRILKRVFQGKQSTPSFPKNEHFLPSDTHTYVCGSGTKKCSFFGKFGVLFFFETPVLRFAFLPYYRRFHYQPVFIF